MDRIPTATDPTKINLPQADLLRRLAEAPKPTSLALNEVPTILALHRRGLVVPVVGGWLASQLGLDVLAGGVVHTDHEPQAGGQSAPRLLVFLNGRQVGEVRYVPGYYPPMGQGRKNQDGWIGIDRNGRQLDFPRKAAAVAWVAGGAR